MARFRSVFVALPSWRAAKNFSTLATLAATCRKNNISPYEAILAAPGGGGIPRAVLPPSILAHRA